MNSPCNDVDFTLALFWHFPMSMWWVWNSSSKICSDVYKKIIEKRSLSLGYLHNSPLVVEKMPGHYLKLGDIVPNFVADTTQGKMDFHGWLEGRL